MNPKSLIAVVGMTAGVAAAQPFEGYGCMRFEVAASQQGPWSSHLEVTPGTHVYMRQRAGWVSPAPVFGWSSATLEEIRFVGANASDTFGVSERLQSSVANRMNQDISPASGFNLWKRQGMPQFWDTYMIVGGVKLDNSFNPDTTGRIVTGQSTFAIGVIWQGFDPTNGVTAILYRFIAGSVGGDSRTIRITGDWFRSTWPSPPLGNQFVVYVNEAGTVTRFTTDAILEEATVTIVPAPAGVAVLLGLPAFRPRRGSRLRT
ncbi:MAG: hypothetical protein FJ255_11940 [Phycisphaerae bacterium]|nr:hypothetical protein [Phycisphaerae bacterium]